MTRVRSFLFVVVATFAVVPGFSGLDPLRRVDGPVMLLAEPVLLAPADPARRRTGRLTFLGGVRLTSDAAGFGGYSAISVRGDRILLLGDGGGLLRFRLDHDWQVREARVGYLPGGPGTGWLKEDRDSEAMTFDSNGRAWISFERANEIWRYAPGLSVAERRAAPAAMRRWNKGRGPEAMVRLRDGRFFVISEGPPKKRQVREGLIFSGDPAGTASAASFTYQPPPGHDVSDMVELTDGRLLVLQRSWRLPLRFGTTMTLVDPGALRPGVIVRGRDIARLEAPLIHENFEGVAAVREGRNTILWIVSDDNESRLQRTLLLKFRLDKGA